MATPTNNLPADQARLILAMPVTQELGRPIDWLAEHMMCTRATVRSICRDLIDAGLLDGMRSRSVENYFLTEAGINAHRELLAILTRAEQGGARG